MPLQDHRTKNNWSGLASFLHHFQQANTHTRTHTFLLTSVLVVGVLKTVNLNKGFLGQNISEKAEPKSVEKYPISYQVDENHS